MAKIVLNIDTPDAAKLKRALEAHALEQGRTVEEALLPVLRGIAQHVGLDANVRGHPVQEQNNWGKVVCHLA